jgi:Xaa-Pro aminopeptidase
MGTVFTDERKSAYLNSRASGRPLVNPLGFEVERNARRYRLARLREQLARHDVAGLLLYDPINIRYATGGSNQQIWTMHNAGRYCLVLNGGPLIMFEFMGCEHLLAGLETIDEIRPAKIWFYFCSGPRTDERAKAWADEIASLVKQHGGSNARLAIDKCEPIGSHLLRELGLAIVEGQQITEHARVIKSADELELMRWTISVCEAGMWRMYESSEPGRTENEIWAELHYENIRNGGEWLETRLLAAGRRTNPWFQECSAHATAAGDLLAFDTDLIGPYGCCADLSRSWTIGHVAPTAPQRRLYALAREQIEHNLALLRPGLSFAEFNAKSWRIPDRFVANRYPAAVHGVGLCDEYPLVPTHPDFAGSYDGVFAESMVVCVESYLGEEGGTEGVKLEVQAVITKDGARRLDTFPFEDWPVA